MGALGELAPILLLAGGAYILWQSGFFEQISAPTESAPAPVTEEPAPVEPTPTPTPTTTTCAERVGESCTCDSCCNGKGCTDGGKIIDKAVSDDPSKCVCKCNKPCSGGGDDGGGGGKDKKDYGQNAQEYDEDSPAGKATSKRINEMTQSSKKKQCSALTGETKKACEASYAQVRFARIDEDGYVPYNWLR